jgi:hypothetical protein
MFEVSGSDGNREEKQWRQQQQRPCSINLD